MTLFEWQPTGPYRVAFSTRIGGVSEGAFASLNLGVYTEDDPDRVRENRRRLCAEVGIEPETATMAWQYHSAEVVKADGRGIVTPGLEFERCDGLWTDEPGRGLMLLTADCLPIAIARTSGAPAVAALHAGWRGLLAGIVESGAAALGGGELPPRSARESAGAATRSATRWPSPSGSASATASSSDATSISPRPPSAPFAPPAARRSSGSACVPRARRSSSSLTAATAVARAVRGSLPLSASSGCHPTTTPDWRSDERQRQTPGSVPASEPRTGTDDLDRGTAPRHPTVGAERGRRARRRGDRAERVRLEAVAQARAG